MRQSSAAAFTSAVSLVCERGGGGGREGEGGKRGREKGGRERGREGKQEGERGPNFAWKGLLQSAWLIITYIFVIIQRICIHTVIQCTYMYDELTAP